MSTDLSNEIHLESALYLVSTPIGHLKDITLRAIDVLNNVDLIVCEDTRHSKKLLNAYGIQTPLKSYHDHSQKKDRDQIVEFISDHKSIALISDAGTPLISDPGFKLVRLCHEKDIRVIPIPGANAVLPAIQLAGLGCEPFLFLGFLPPKSQARQTYLKSFVEVDTSLVFYESPKRVLASLHDCYVSFGDRSACVIRELTKIYETAYRDKLSHLIRMLDNPKEAIKGEITVVIGPPQNTKTQMNQNEVIEILKNTLTEHSLKDAVQAVTDLSGWRKKDVYDMALKIQKD